MIQIKASIQAILTQNKKMTLNELRRRYFHFTGEDLWCLCDSLFIYTDDSFIRCFDSFRYKLTKSGQYEISKHTQDSMLESMIQRCGYRNKKKKQR